MGLGAIEVIILVCIVVMPVIALVDVLTSSFWENNKIIWILVVIFLPILDSILYFLIVRNQRIRY